MTGARESVDLMCGQDARREYTVPRCSAVQYSAVQYSEVTNTIVDRCDGKQPLCDKINQWVANNTAWVRSQLGKHRWVE